MNHQSVLGGLIIPFYPFPFFVSQTFFDICCSRVQHSQKQSALLLANLIASILECYSTINNVIVERVERSAIRGAVQDISHLDKN
jgi:hypothetical protein